MKLDLCLSKYFLCFLSTVRLVIIHWSDCRVATAFNMPPGHSRNKSDDSEKLFFGVENEVFLAPEEQVSETENCSFEPTLSFRQPNVKFTSFFTRSRARLSAIISIPFRAVRNNIPSWFRPVRIFTYTPLSVVVLLLAIIIPLALGTVAVLRNYKETNEFFKVDKSLKSFEIPNHEASLNYDAFRVADRLSKRCTSDNNCRGFKQARSKRSAELPTLRPVTRRKYPVSSFQRSAKWTLDLVYVAVGEGDNIFEKERLETIHKVEQKLMEHKDFEHYCWKWSKSQSDPVLKEKYKGCTPPISLIDFFYPSVYDQLVINDGQGTTELTGASINNTLNFLLSNSFTYWFVDSHFSHEKPRSKFLRAQLKFGYPFKSYKGGYLHWEKWKIENEQFEKYVVTYVDELKKMSTE